MRLFPGRVPIAAADILRGLTTDNLIEVSNGAEAQLDVEAVLKEYLRQEREIGDRARAVMDSRGLSHEHFGRTKRQVAEERGFGLGEDSVGWIADQLIEVFMHSAHVEEVFADDATLRAKIRDVLRKHMAADDELDVEVRKRIQNLQEGTAAWDIEYAKAMETIKRAKGLG